MKNQREIDKAKKRFEEKLADAHATLNDDLMRLVEIPTPNMAPKIPFDSQQDQQLHFLKHCLLTKKSVLNSFLEVVSLRTIDAAEWTTKYREKLDEWMEQHNILLPWSFVPFDCMAVNIKNGTPVDNAIKTPGGVKFSSAEEDTKFTFSNDGYSLTTDGLGRESAKFARNLSTRLFEHALKQVVNTKKQGFVSAKKSRKRESEPEHRYKWLARFVVQEWTEEQILAEYKKKTGKDYDKSNLDKHMRTLAAEIDLPLPKRPRGPKKRTKR